MLLFSSRNKGFLLCLLTIWWSCSYSGTWQTAATTTSDGKARCSLSIPDYLDDLKDQHLHRSAALQYGNFFRNTYMVLVDTVRTEQMTMEEYARQTSQQLIETLERPQKIDSTYLQIDAKKALQVAYTGTVGIEKIRERIYYQLVFVEGKSHYYQLVLWTWDQWRDKYKTDFTRVVESLRCE